MASSRRVVIEFLGKDSGLGKTTAGVGGEMSKLEGAFSKVGSVAKAGFAVAATAAVAAGAAIGGALLSALDQEKSTDRMAAALGATPKIAEKYGKISSNLYAGAWGESMDDVTHAVESVASSFRGLGKSGNLEKVTAQALDFAAIFEVDLPRATQVASTVMKSGLAKNATEAFDLLTAASQRVPAALRGDVQDAAEEYGQFFKTLGFSGEQAFGVLVEGAKKGMYGIDKAGDAIKEFTIRSTDMSKSTIAAYEAVGLDYEKMTNSILAGGPKSKKAFSQILTGLLDIKDPAKQAEKALALFGTPMEDLNVKDIPKFLKSLQDGTKGMKDWKGSIDDAGKTLNDNASTNLESFKRQITQGFVNLIGGKVLPTLTRFSAQLARDVGPAMQKLGMWIQAEVVPALQKLGMWLGQNLPPLFARVRQVIKQFTSGGSGDIGKFFADVKGIFHDGVAIVTRLWKMFGKNILGFLKGWVKSIVQIFKGVFQVVKGIFKVFSGILTGDWKKVWSGIKDIFKGVANILIGLVKNLWNTIKFAFKNAGVVLKAVVKGMWDGIKSLAKSGADYLVDRIKEIPTKIRSVLGKFTEVGKDLVGAIANGIKNAAGFASDFAGEIWAAVKGAINSGISSLNNLLEFSVKVGPKTFTVNPPDIGYLARGTDNWRGGLAVVGEEGPELVNLPRGSRVTPHGESMGQLRGMGGGVTVVIQGALDPVAVGRQVEQVLVKYQRATGRPLQVTTA